MQRSSLTARNSPMIMTIPKQAPIQCTPGTDVNAKMKHPIANVIPAIIGTYSRASTPFSSLYLRYSASLAKFQMNPRIAPMLVISGVAAPDRQCNLHHGKIDQADAGDGEARDVLVDIRQASDLDVKHAPLCVSVDFCE